MVTQNRTYRKVTLSRASRHDLRLNTHEKSLICKRNLHLYMVSEYNATSRLIELKWKCSKRVALSSWINIRVNISRSSSFDAIPSWVEDVFKRIDSSQTTKRCILLRGRLKNAATLTSATLWCCWKSAPFRDVHCGEYLQASEIEESDEHKIEFKTEK